MKNIPHCSSCGRSLLLEKEPSLHLERVGLYRDAIGICDALEVKPSVVLVRGAIPRRWPDVIRARHQIWKLLNDAGIALAEIGRVWGVDHTTVMAGVRRAA